MLSFSVPPGYIRTTAVNRPKLDGLPFKRLHRVEGATIWRNDLADPPEHGGQIVLPDRLP
jgi:hypothetical protein